MKTLTDAACADWLAARQLVAGPYVSKEARHLHDAQFPLPRHAPIAAAMLRSIVTCAEPFEAALLHITDWAHYSPDEMAIVARVREACAERRPLIETPGHIFSASERDLLLGLLALVTAYGWTAYLYFDHGLTLLSWEGELLDLWDTDGARFTAVHELLQQMGISPNATRST